MGMFSKSSDYRAAANCRAPCDPVPTRFVIERVEVPVVRKVKTRAPRAKVGQMWRHRTYLLAEIRYPDCTTFDGRKLILFDGVTTNWLRRQTHIDPHFTEGGHIIARFAPTNDGLALARRAMR